VRLAETAEKADRDRDAFPRGRRHLAITAPREERIQALGARAQHEVVTFPASHDVDRSEDMTGGVGIPAAEPLEGGGIHETNCGGHLDVHVDFNVNERTGLYRRLNILVYFNIGWKDEYGGILDLWDADVEHCLARIAPTFNRAAGFATSATSWHGVTPVTCPAGSMRRSFAAYYYTREPPPGWDGVRRSTVFRARPDERWKGGVAMPVESLLHATRAGFAAAKKKVRDALS